MSAALQVTDTSYPSDGATVAARLFLPERTTGPGPGVLLCPGRMRDVDGLSFLCEALAGAGITVLATTYRGLDFRTDDRDSVDGLTHLSRLAAVDPARIGIVGHSRGAMASLRVAGQDERVRSAVALMPVGDFGNYVRATRDYARTRYDGLVKGMGGTPDELPDVYAALSPLHFAARIKVPVLLVGGSADMHTPVDHAIALRDALLAAGNQQVRLEVLDGVGHFFERTYAERADSAIVELSVSWLSRTLSTTAR